MNLSLKNSSRTSQLLLLISYIITNPIFSWIPRLAVNAIFESSSMGSNHELFERHYHNEQTRIIRRAQKENLGPGRWGEIKERLPGRHQTKIDETNVIDIKKFAKYAQEASCLSGEEFRLTDDVYGGCWLVKIRGKDLTAKELRDKGKPTSPYFNVKEAKVDQQYFEKFLKAQEELEKKFLLLKESREKKDKIRYLKVVGFGLGGVYALFAGDLFRQKYGLFVKIYTFGMPRVGNRAFADHINKLMPNQVFRMTNTFDIIPTLPDRGIISPASFMHPAKEFWLGTEDCACRAWNYSKKTKDYPPIFECIGYKTNDVLEESALCLNQVNQKELDERLHYGPYNMGGFDRSNRTIDPVPFTFTFRACPSL
ncbi:hypothetical protein G9A89_014261 [Geosiphon pyriformis]|nr:hypothetical protein G9A89_014261 [Geosiphon pyriformis]